MDDFAIVFTSAVHGGLDRVLGQSGTSAVLVHLKMTNDLPDAAEFHEKLLVLFGARATLSLERAIVRDLAARLKWSLNASNYEGAFDFKATIGAAREGAKA